MLSSFEKKLTQAEGGRLSPFRRAGRVLDQYGPAFCESRFQVLDSMSFSCWQGCLAVQYAVQVSRCRASYIFSDEPPGHSFNIYLSWTGRINMNSQMISYRLMQS